jgi:hypothetical protein
MVIVPLAFSKSTRSVEVDAPTIFRSSIRALPFGALDGAEKRTIAMVPVDNADTPPAIRQAKAFSVPRDGAARQTTDLLVFSAGSPATTDEGSICTLSG